MKVLAFKRELQGTGASRRLRRSGHTPGIVYGGTASPIAISLDHNALYHALKKEVFHASILDLEIDGVVEKVLLRDFQVHAYKQIVLHADFQRVDANQKITVKVPIHFTNEDISPAVKLHSAVISHVMVDLEISCLPGDLPEFITVDLAHLDAGQSLHVNDIPLPNGVAAITHGENQTVAIATVPAGATAAEAAAEEVGAGKPAAQVEKKDEKK